MKNVVFPLILINTIKNPEKTNATIVVPNQKFKYSEKNPETNGPRKFPNAEEDIISEDPIAAHCSSIPG